MDWPRAIDRNRDALMRIVAALFALAGLASPGPSRRGLGEGGRGEFTLPRHLYAAILLILRPAESAVRRIIVILAECCKKPGSLPAVARAADAVLLARLLQLGKLSAALRTPAFALFDPLKPFDPDVLWNVDPARQIRFLSGLDAGPDPFSGFRTRSDQQAPVPAAAILQRLSAIRHALDTLPRQARRLLRWQARRDVLLKAGRRTRVTPFRPGFPPGWRERHMHEIDDVLKECHGLALDRLDTG